MNASLLDWVDHPRGGHGAHFDDDAGGWSYCEYPSLARGAHAVAGELVAAGLPQDGVVCLVLRTSAAFVEALFGTWIAGGTVCPMVPPQPFEQAERYALQASHILRSARPSLVATDPSLRAVVEQAMRLAGLDGSPLLLSPGSGSRPANRRRTAEIALLQFTSGSSGLQRGVRVSFENLTSDIAMIRRWLEMRPEDGTATWLPLYHDMGLIGCLLTPVLNQSDVWIMRPDQFVRSPERWLACFGRGDASLTSAPNFGFAYAARKVAPEALDGMDFSGWRGAIVGAEPIDVSTLEAFSRLLRPHGFSRAAFLPAYGLAEATLAVTGLPLPRIPRVARIDWSTLSFGQPLALLDSRMLGEEAVGGGAGWLVGCGIPHEGLDVTVVDSGGEPLAPLHLGEIVVAGPSVASGYHLQPATGSTRFVDGRLHTGDAGFVYHDELFVIGRMADSLKVRGRSIYVEDLEARLVSDAGLGLGRCVVLAHAAQGLTSVAVLAETSEREWADKAGEILRKHLGSGVPIRILAGPKGVIQRTSSGKPRRRFMWDQILAGKLEADVLLELA